MSSDRTLMSVVRTSLSLIGFGFTIFQFFHTLNTDYLAQGLPPRAPRLFGGALVALGIMLLVLGILEHLRETRSRRARRTRLYQAGLVRHVEPVKPSYVLVVAILLLLVGVLSFLSIAFRAGPL
jgi:putative membrane protein